MTPQERAEKSAKAMWSTDSASKWLGARIDAVGPGTATLSMQVAEHQSLTCCLLPLLMPLWCAQGMGTPFAPMT